MSYSLELKRQLAEKETKKSCCRRALLYGILGMRATHEGDCITLSVEATAVAPLAAREIRRVLSAEPTVCRFGPKRSRARLTFRSPAAAAYLRGELTCPVSSTPCPNCTTHFLRGIFLAAGRMSDYKKLYRLEFSAGGRETPLSVLLSESVGEPKRTERRGEVILYYKTNAAICDFLALIGAETNAFDLINDNIEAGYRNAANRRANCEARNIERAVEASMRFVQIYRRLLSEDKLGKLPEELRETARLRAENPSVSLATLGARCTPPISKSGMNHRLERIEALAEELLLGSEEE